MLNLFNILLLLLEVFVYCVLAVTSVVVIYALLQWWADKSRSTRLTS